MEQFFVHICSETPMVFAVNGHQIGFVEQEYDCINLKLDEDFVLSCYPTTQTPEGYNLSFNAKICILASKLISTHNNISITDYGKGEFFINVSPLIIPYSPNASEPFYHTLNDLSFAINKNILNVSNGKNGLYYPLAHILKNISIKQNNDLIELNGQTASQKSFSLFINQNLQVQFDGLADKIEYDGNQIVTLQKIPDIARHGLVTIYKRTSNGFKKTQQYSVYTQNEPVAPACNEALPLAFMEAINIENFALARSYLHPNLSNSLQDNTIKSYFGDFIEFMPNNNTPNEIALIYKGSPRFVKVYHFDIKDGRICDIDVLT